MKKGDPTETIGDVIARDLTNAGNHGDIIRDVSFRVPPGQFVSIVGRNNLPASGLLRLLAGFTSPKIGSVTIGGTNLGQLSPTELGSFRRRNIGLVFPTTNLVPTLTVSENITFTARATSAGVDEELLNHLLNATHLSPFKDSLPSELPPLQKQLIACARALMLKPAALIATNPSANLLPEAATVLFRFLRDHAHTLHVPTILITDDVKVGAFTDRTLVLPRGQVVADLTRPDETAIDVAIQEADSDSFELVGILDEIAPQKPLTPKQQQVLVQAQTILESLPGPVINLDHR